MLTIHSLKADFQTSPHLFIGLIDNTSDPRGAQVCLVSDLEFTGNARFKAGNYFIYPSIQSFIWKVALNLIPLPVDETKILKASEMDIWPTLDKQTRIELASNYELPYFSATLGIKPTPVFNKLVMDLFELGQDFVIPELEPDYMSFERYIELWKNDPIKLLTSQENLALAIGSRIDLPVHLEKMSAETPQDLLRDFKRVMLPRMTDVLTRQKKWHNGKSRIDSSYLTVMESLGIQRAVVSDSKPDVPYLRRRAKGKKITVYFAGERI